MFARRRDVLEREADRIGALAVRGDVTNPRDLAAVVRPNVEAFGGHRHPRLEQRRPAARHGLAMTPEGIEDAVELLLIPAVRLVELCLPHLVQSPAGRILFFTSIAVKEPADHLALIERRSAGRDRLGEVACRASSARSGVTVNCVAPGRIDTARLAQLYPEGPTEADLKAIPLGRWGTPQEFGDVACFLASDRARYVTGTTVVVDGGLSRGLL